jgi:hypothetical protein
MRGNLDLLDGPSSTVGHREPVAFENCAEASISSIASKASRTTLQSPRRSVSARTGWASRHRSSGRSTPEAVHHRFCLSVVTKRSRTRNPSGLRSRTAERARRRVDRSSPPRWISQLLNAPTRTPMNPKIAFTPQT